MLRLDAAVLFAQEGDRYLLSSRRITTIPKLSKTWEDDFPVVSPAITSPGFLNLMLPNLRWEGPRLFPKVQLRPRLPRTFRPIVPRPRQPVPQPRRPAPRSGSSTSQQIYWHRHPFLPPILPRQEGLARKEGLTPAPSLGVRLNSEGGLEVRRPGVSQETSQLTGRVSNEGPVEIDSKLLGIAVGHEARLELLD